MFLCRNCGVIARAINYRVPIMQEPDITREVLYIKDVYFRYVEVPVCPKCKATVSDISVSTNVSTKEVE